MRIRQRHNVRLTVIVAAVVAVAGTLTTPALARERASSSRPHARLATRHEHSGAGIGAAVPDWSSYLFASDHAGYNPTSTAITPAKAASLATKWQWKPASPTVSGQPQGLYSSPVVYGGRVYIGARTGWFYALNEKTGKVVWKDDVGFIAGTTCGPEGFTSTATVALDPVTGKPTVYVAAADGYLYALDAGTGVTVWRTVIGLPSTTVNDYYNWSSPTVSNGVVYIGTASECDNPLVPGGVVAVQQSSGSVIATYHSTPPGVDGASVWGSVLVTDSGGVFADTGNGPSGTDAVTIMRLVLDPVAGTLTKVDSWQIPKALQSVDSDWGSSPTAFTATINGVPRQMVGACNKNGLFYAFDASDLAAGPVWSRAVGAAYRTGTGECDAAAVWDGSRLFVASNATTVGGVAYGGSVRQVDPATGAVIWETGLPGPVIGSPTLDGGGVLAVGVFVKGPGPYLLDASTGALLYTFPNANGKSFSQSIYTDSGLLLETTYNHGIVALGPS